LSGSRDLVHKRGVSTKQNLKNKNKQKTERNIQLSRHKNHNIEAGI
jgi:hypothetical protein